MDAQLEATRQSQRAWSKTADSLKTRYDRARKLCLGLTIAAALLAAGASQLPDSTEGGAAGGLRVWLSIASGVLLALVSLFTLRFITGQSAAWVRARTTSEALKRIAWTYAAEAAPYEDPDTRHGKLGEDRAAIEAAVDELLALKVTVPDPPRKVEPPDRVDRSAYVTSRPGSQQGWYERRAEEHNKIATRLRRIELFLVVLATALTVVVGTMDKTRIGTMTIDLIALTGVITTMSGATLAYIEASRLDFLVISYRAAARQLREFVAAAPSSDATVDEWSAYVRKVENLLATENGAWMTKLAAPTAN